MDNLDVGNIAIATVIVGIFDLLIILLIRTETILKVVERIKGVIRVDYRSRAKRSEDEVRISKKHAQVARERVRQSFVTMQKWSCKWTWNWSESFEPISVQGYCLGDRGKDADDDYVTFRCSHPVRAYYYYDEDETEDKKKNPSTTTTLGISCSRDGWLPHRTVRATFEVYLPDALTATEEFHLIISKVILSERDLRIAKEIKKLRLQFWR